MRANHRTLEGEVVSLRGLTRSERAFLRQLDSLNKLGMNYFDLLRAAIGPGTPALEGRAALTARSMDRPVYVVARDIAMRAGVAQKVLLHPRDQKTLDDARMKIGPMLSVAQAAEYIGISRAAIYKAIDNGALESIPIGSLTAIPFASAKAYRRRRDAA